MFNDRDLAILGVGAALAVMCLLLPFEFSVKVVFGIILLAFAMVLALLRLGPDRVPLETWFYRRFRFWIGAHRFVYHREGYAVRNGLGHDDRVPQAKPGFWPAYLSNWRTCPEILGWLVCASSSGGGVEIAARQRAVHLAKGFYETHFCPAEAAITGPHDQAMPEDTEQFLARGAEAVLLPLSDQEDTVRGIEDILITDYGFPVNGPALLAVDYLQRIPVIGLTGRISEDLRAGEAAARLRALSCKHGWAIIAAAALSKDNFDIGDLDDSVLAALLGDERVPYECGQTLEQFDNLQEVLGHTLEDVHNLAVQLRPSVLDDLGLKAALERFLVEWQSRYNPQADVVIHLDGKRLPETVETALYRMVQEALTNVARHAEANSVSLLLTRQENEVITVIEDDGVGFDRQQMEHGPHLGLPGIQERTELLDGKLVIETAPGQGTSLFIRIPLGLNHHTRD